MLSCILLSCKDSARAPASPVPVIIYPNSERDLTSEAMPDAEAILIPDAEGNWS